MSQMLAGLPSEVQEEILKWCQRIDILNVVLTCSKMYTETTKKLMWNTVKLDIDQLKLDKHRLPMLKHTKCLTLFKKEDEKGWKDSSYSTETARKEHLSDIFLDRSWDNGFEMEQWEWNNKQWNNEQKAWNKWGASNQEIQQENTDVGESAEYSLRKNVPNDNLILSQLDLPKLTELRISDIVTMSCKNSGGRYFTEHSSDVLEKLLRNLKNLKSLQVVHLSNTEGNIGWQTDSNSLQRALCKINSCIYLMTKDEYRHIENIPHLRELKFTNIWIGKPFEIPNLKKLSVNFWTCSSVKVRLGVMENLREFEGTDVTLVGEDFLDGVNNLEKLKLCHCKNLRARGLKVIARHTHIRELDVQDDNLIDDQLMHLQQMFSLRLLKIDTSNEERMMYPLGHPDSKITCLDFLTNMVDLQELTIFAADLSDDGAKLISTLRDLEKLRITHSYITGELTGVFTHLSQLPKLRHLDLSHTCRYKPLFKNGRFIGSPDADGAIRKLSQISSLQTLNIQNFSGVTGAAFVGFTSLRHLNTKGIEFGDLDLAYISYLNSLEELNVSLDMHVTKEGIRWVRMLPRLKSIHIWDSPYIGFDITESLELMGREEELCVKISRTKYF